MLKQIFFALGLTLSLSATAELAVTPDGTIKNGRAMSFRLVHWDEAWQAAVQNRSTVTPEPNFPKQSEKEFRQKGAFAVRSGSFQLSETVNRVAADRLNVRYELNSPDGVSGKMLALECVLPIDLLPGKSVFCDGKPLGFGEKFAPQQWQIHEKSVSTLSIPSLSGGELVISGKFSLSMQDNRKFKGKTIALRIPLKCDTTNPVRKAELELAFRAIPPLEKTLSLRACANMGFADEVPGDGKGGWTDQGAENDMRHLKPGQLDAAGIPFDLVDPAQNRGKSCIVLRGEARPYFPEQAELSLDQECKAKYLYILHAVAWPVRQAVIGEITCEYAQARNVEKQIRTFEVRTGHDVANFWTPRPLKNGVVGWTGTNNSSNVGLYVSCFELSGEAVKKLTFNSRGKSVWMIAGATLSNRRLNSNSVRGGFTAREDASWRLLREPFKPVKAGSSLDFSFLLDAPAGKYGFVRTDGERLTFEKAPQKEFRFYGANLCFSANFIDRETARFMAQDFAAMGYNLVRFHHFDGTLVQRTPTDSTRLDPKAADQMDFLWSEFRKRGVYATLDLYVSRKFGAQEFPHLKGRTISQQEFKALVFVDEAAMRNFEAFSRNFLTRVNPYTRLAWKDDPALVSISLINEDTIFAIANQSPWIRELYEKKFDESLRTRKIVPTPPERARLWQAFLIDTYRTGFHRMKRFVRSLGVQAPITDQNFWTSPATALLRGEYDLVDCHFYWGHPVFLEKSWSLPALVHNDSATTRGAGGVSGLFSSRIFGKPFTVTEWDYVTPNPYAVEGAFLMGAYSALQGWTGMCRFAYSHVGANIGKPLTAHRFFDLVNDPLRRFSERAGAVFFLRSDVAPARNAYAFDLKQEQITGIHPLQSFPGDLQRLGLISRVGTRLAGVPAADGIKTEFPDLTGKLLFKSDTGELKLDREAGSFAAVTPRSEGFVLMEGQTGAGKFMSVRNTKGFAAILAASCDGEKLTDAKRVLLLHLTESRNPGLRFLDGAATILANQGQPGVLIRRGTAEVHFPALRSGTKLYRLSFTGERRAELPLQQTQEGFTVTLDTFTPDGGLAVAYELVRP